MPPVCRCLKYRVRPRAQELRWVRRQRSPLTPRAGPGSTELARQALTLDGWFRTPTQRDRVDHAERFADRSSVLVLCRARVVFVEPRSRSCEIPDCSDDCCRGPCVRHGRVDGQERPTLLIFLPSTEDVDDLIGNFEPSAHAHGPRGCVRGQERPRLFGRGRRVTAAAVLTAEEFQITKVYQQTGRLPGDINWIFAVERVDQQ